MVGKEEAVSSVIAVVIASSLFVTTIGIAIFVAQDAGSAIENTISDTGMQVEASALAAFLVKSPGHAPGAEDWAEDDAADSLSRLGLRNRTGDHIDFVKLENLRLAPNEADATDGYVNYEEAVARFGLQDVNMGFHIRSFPSLPSIEQLLATGYRDPNLKVAYIGDYETSGGATDPDSGLVVSDPVCSLSSADTSVWQYVLTVTNGGTATSQFELTLDGTTGDGDSVFRKSRSNQIGAGSSDVLRIDLPALTGRDVDPSSGAELTFRISDSAQALRSTTYTTDLPSCPSPASTTSKDLEVEASKMVYEEDEDVVLDYSDSDVAEGDVLTLTIQEGTSTSGAVVHTQSITAPKQLKKQKVTIADGTFDDGFYTAYLERADTGLNVSHQFLMVDVGNLPATYSPAGGGSSGADAAVGPEVGFLEKLVEQFCPYEFDSTTATPMAAAPTWASRCAWKGSDPQPGDVFPDIKSNMNNDLPDRLLDGTGAPDLSRTTVLVVGSGVDHKAMTSGAAKHAVADWVDAGGTLIVFGSDKQNVQWLNPIFHTGINSSSGGLSTPDEGHPLLHVPDELAYEDYDNNDLGWKFTAGSDDHFTDVVKQGTTPITTVSKPGRFGSGNVLLSTWQPHDPYGDGTSNDEGLRMVNNFVTLSYRSLYLDYGPEIPDGVAVIPAVSRAVVEHPQLGDVTLDFVVYVFPV